MLRFILFIALLLSSLTLVESMSATVIYTPGAMIAMTGSNTDVRFDVASVLLSEGSSEIVPTLISTTLTFTGTFYASGIGWIVFASGSNQVSLNCGIQPITSLSALCTLTGLGWSENVGDIDFAQVAYNPNTGLLEGTGVTFVGDISFSGIALPLRPVIMNESALVANHTATLSIKNAWMYDAGTTGWNGAVVTGLDSQSIVGVKGIYTVDFSLTNTYTITITDTNDSKTEISGFIVSPAGITTTINTGNFHAKIFCNSAGSGTINCPDTTTSTTDDNISATTLLQEPPSGGSPVIADGSSKYTLTLRARDQYGNRVETGTMQIKYDTTVKNVQTDPLNGTDNPNYGPSSDGDAFISDKIPTGLFGTSEKTLTLTPSDITYFIASRAPTNTDNTITLNSVIYSSGGTDTALALGSSSLTFTPLFEAYVTTGPPVINTPHTFQTTVTTNSATTITPTTITTMQIGDGSMAEWRSLSPRSAPDCTKEPTSSSIARCDWGSFVDPVSVIATTTGVSSFAFTGTYTTWSTSSEPTTIQNYIYYMNGVIEVLYSTISSNAAIADPATQRIRVLGQSGEGVGGGAQTRVNLINSIRKQVALLSRNRPVSDPYNDVDYQVVNGNYTISSNTVFEDTTGIKAKRTLVVIAGDITVDTDIALREHPLAIIALADSAGKGGNIIINGGITDIHSSLIAEHAITSARSDSQLYIHGSLVSANPPREIAPTTCPYFAPSGCTRSDYDLPGSRDGYAALSPADQATNKSAGSNTYSSPLVIEGDPRIIRDPAPAMSK